MALIILCNVAIAVHGLLLQLLPSTVSVWAVLFFGKLVAAVLFAPSVLRRRGGLQRFRGEHRLLLIRAIITISALGLTYYGVRRLPLAEAIMLVNTQMLWTPLVSRVVLHEPMPPLVWGPLVLGFVGVGLVLHPSLATTTDGALAALLAGFLAACQAVASRRLGKLNATTAEVIFYTGLVGVFVTALPAWPNLATMDPDIALKLTMIGLIPPFTGFAVVEVLRLRPAWFVTALNGVSPIAGGLLDWWVMDRPPTPMAFAGMALIFVSAVVIARLASARSGAG